MVGCIDEWVGRHLQDLYRENSVIIIGAFNPKLVLQDNYWQRGWGGAGGRGEGGSNQGVL